MCEAPAARLRFCAAPKSIPAPALLGAYIEVDEVRFGQHEIHYLYENAAYPLTRREVVSPI